MQDKISYSTKWDMIGVGASLFCAVHCLLLPLLVTTLPLLGMEMLENPAIETATLIISMLAGIAALYTGGYKSHHRRLWPMGVFVAGMIAMIAGNIAGFNRIASEAICKTAGIVCILTAHTANWVYRRRCCTHDSDHSHDLKSL
ncbi:MAG: MerC domain-containing protein [Chitinophagaceae bacterium]|nr:MerC domain-containing protein [Chitinophagaceae bacterium]